MDQFDIDYLVKEITRRCDSEAEVHEMLSHLASINWTDVMTDALILREKRIHTIRCQICNNKTDDRECKYVLSAYGMGKSKCWANCLLLCQSCVENKASFKAVCLFCHKEEIALGDTGETYACVDCRNIVEGVYSQNMRARLMGLRYTLTLDQWKQTLDYFQEKCVYCSGKSQCIEHYIPLTLNGETSVGNCVPSCNKCNTKKSNKHPSELDSLFPADNLARIREYLASVATVAV